MQLRRTGTGPPVLFVHGSMLGGRYQWLAQAELRHRFELLVAEREGYRDGDDGGEDWSVDAEQIAAVLAAEPGGAHVVGFSYGAVGCALAAAAAPERVRSLTLIEPSMWSVAFDVPAVCAAYDRLVGAVIEFGDDPAALAQAFLDRAGAPQTVRRDRLPRALEVGVRAVSAGRPSGEAKVPLAELARAPFPVVVVSGGHSVAFETIADRVAFGIGARRERLPGAGHAVPTLGDPLNTLLEELWRQAEELRSTVTSGG